ncbi:hypothetical protein [Streptomyces sp. NRRL B-24484]|uniref:hypothetical protein n=1 Tax=Streptomyces sp. NRRL B-24484 TaxID=1463833 RepID=UPI0004BEBFB3|nr:hypothetical protein [Streptomyces sp. NRRL B-24484]
MVVLTVDGTEISLGHTQRLRQQSPYPGGHRYRVVIEGPATTGRWFTDVASETDLSDQDQWMILRGLDRVVGSEKIEEVPAEFLLNSVDSFVRDGDRICIEGVCSEVVPPRR